jgi:hypothetical protein
MKFSDMMGKGQRKGATDTDDEPEGATSDAAATRFTPVAAESSIRLGGNRSELDEAAAAVGGGSPLADPSISEVVAELAPRAAGTRTAPVADAPVDTASWLDGMHEIDDDLLPGD